MDILLLVARLVLFGVFAVAGVTKLLDLAGSQQAMRGFGLPEALAKPAGIALPVAELLVAVLLLPVATAGWGALLGMLLLVAFVGGIAYNLSKGRTPDCHCFGQLHSEPIGRPTLIRNGVLALVALPVAVRGLGGDAGTSVVGWMDDLSALGWVTLTGALVVLAVLAGVVWLLTHLLGQNGRLLVRLDAVEGALRERNLLPAVEEEESDEGLPVGVPAPAFTVSDLAGSAVTLDRLRAAGKPVVLIFSDPTCGPCNALLPDIGRWQRDPAAAVTVAMISRGGADANRSKQTEHGLSQILLQEDGAVSAAYEAHGTPIGVMVRPDGTIGSRAAPGGDAIRRLVARAVAQPGPSGNGREAPRPPMAAANLGRPAPSVSLPDLGGQTVTLEEFSGRRTVVLFWNPGCGFCERMLADVKAWEENPPAGAPGLLVVSSGDAETNRAAGWTSPVVLDQGFATGRAFGASGTPSAVMVDAKGNIASGVAVGAPSVLGLLRNEAVPVEEEAEPEAATPEIGDEAPSVTLPDLDGNMVDLADHRGTRTLLVFWSPGCGFCERMLPDLKKWEAKPPKGAPKLVLLSSGTVEENREMGLRSPILLDDSFSAGAAFGSDGTPSAIMIDAKGRIASDLAVGAPDVLKLARTSKDPVPQTARA